MAAKPAVPARSLIQFSRDRRLSECKVCALPPDILDQLRQAGAKKISVSDRVLWLTKELNIPITEGEMIVHTRGAHDVTR